MKFKLLILLFIIMLFSGCDFEEINQPSNAVVNEIIYVNTSVNASSSSDLGQLLEGGVQLPNGWNIINFTYKSFVNSTPVSGIFFTNSTITSKLINNYGDKSGYTWYGFTGNTTISPDLNKISIGEIYINVTTIGVYNLSYYYNVSPYLSTNYESRYSTNNMINVTSPIINPEPNLDKKSIFPAFDLIKLSFFLILIFLIF